MAVSLGIFDGVLLATALKDTKTVKTKIPVPAPYIVTLTLDSKAVGEIVKMPIDGVDTDFIVVHKGNPAGRDPKSPDDPGYVYEQEEVLWDSYYNHFDDTVTIMMKDLYVSKVWNPDNNFDGYGCDKGIHRYLHDEFGMLMDQKIRNKLIEVCIPEVGYSSGIRNFPRGAAIFLPSANELGLRTGDSSHILMDGFKFDYFITGNDTAAKTKRKSMKNSAFHNYWLRDTDVSRDRLHAGGTNIVPCALAITASGDVTFTEVTLSLPIRPTMVLPGSTLITNEGLIVG
jgi:acyl-CoA synthetase (AMP-forming)/AMP-acid ligase II